MKSPGPRRVLVVANRTAATPHLLDAVKRYARDEPTMFALLIPDAPKSEHTDWTLERALPMLERAAGAPVHGLTGSTDDPFEAVRAVLSEDPYDRVLISTLPRRVSKWLRRDLPKRVEALGVPVEVVSPDKHERVGDLFADGERSGLPPAGLGGV
jgi:hypothetical protein